MRFDIITIFPDSLDSYLNTSFLKIAQEKKLIEIHIHNLRDFSEDKHKNVDDTPYSGGPGMLLTPEPLYNAINKVKEKNKGKVIFFTPQGKTLTQNRIIKLQNDIQTKKVKDGYILICGRYEGVDYRIREMLIDEEYSVGKYILTGGELPALCFIDSIIRLIPGVIGNSDSHLKESFSKEYKYKKEYPQYTKPANFKGYKVPDVLRSGNHKEIEKWKKNNLK